jgi:hypothetical protein
MESEETLRILSLIVGSSTMSAYLINLRRIFASTAFSNRIDQNMSMHCRRCPNGVLLHHSGLKTKVTISTKTVVICMYLDLAVFII